MPELTIVSFNAHGGVRPRPISLPQPVARRRRPSGGPYGLDRVLIDFVHGHGADVIVLQESFRPDAAPSVAESTAPALGMTCVEVPFGRATLEPWPHLTREGVGTKGLAVLTRHPVLAQRVLRVPRVPADPAPHRGALALTLDVDGTRLDLWALHLTSRLPHGPPLQLRWLRPQLPGPEGAVVLVGDFNFWGPPVARLLPGWRRTVRGRTWPAHRPHSQIDHVLVPDVHGAAGALEVRETAVLDDVGSDHRPVRVTLHLR